MEELKDEKTNVTPQEMALALVKAYWQYFNSWPKKDTIKVLLAQWALETGWGKSMHCFNVGNAKSREGDWHNYCFFKCNEILRKDVAEQLLHEDPTRVIITSYRTNNACVTWFLPKHPWSRFRAFRTLEDGVYDHLKMVVKRFDRAWLHAVAGDPRAYSRALKAQKYYTADEASYTRTLVSVFNKLDSLEMPQGPLVTPEDRQRVLASISLSLSEMVEDIHLRDE
jgi:hypothetical protein